MGENSKKRRIFLVLVVCLLLVITGAFFWMKLCSSEVEKLDGEWSFYYFYSNDSSLVYKGTMIVELEEALLANFEIYAPKSKRAEMITARNITYDRASRTLSGVLLHDRYKIREGHLLEDFELVFEGQGQFSGTGHCREYCAEGTENKEITWMGMRPISD